MKTPESFGRILAQTSNAITTKNMLFFCGGMALAALEATGVMYHLSNERAKEGRNLLEQTREQVQHVFDQQKMSVQCNETEFIVQNKYDCDTNECRLGKTAILVNFLCDSKRVTCDNNSGEMACNEVEKNN